MGCQDNPKEVSSFFLFFAKLGSFCNTVSGSWLNPLATVHLVVDSSRGKFSRWTCFVFAEMVPIGVCSTLKNGRWEKREGEACNNGSRRNSDQEVRRAVTGSPEEGLQDEKGLGDNGNPLQYSCLESPMDRGAWWATVHGVTKSQTRRKQFSMHATTCC